MAQFLYDVNLESDYYKSDFPERIQTSRSFTDNDSGIFIFL